MSGFRLSLPVANPLSALAHMDASTRLLFLSGVFAVTSAGLWLQAYRSAKKIPRENGVPREYEVLVCACNAWEERLKTGESTEREVAKDVLEHIYRALDVYHQGLQPAETGFDEDETSSVDSFMSAEGLDEEELELDVIAYEQDIYLDNDVSGTQFYLDGLNKARSGVVRVRESHIKRLGCESEEDYLAKVYCLRLGFSRLLKNKQVSRWFQKAGRLLMSRVLRKAHADVEGFHQAYDELMDYVISKTSEEIAKELEYRKVVHGGFFDVALEFVLLDSFDDLENPPSVITAVISNRWLPTAMKKTALETATRTVLSAKQKALPNPDGFMSRFYRVAYYVSPVLALGFLGPPDELHATCDQMKSLIVRYMTEIFDTAGGRYSSCARLEKDLFQLAKKYMEEAERTL